MTVHIHKSLWLLCGYITRLCRPTCMSCCTHAWVRLRAALSLYTIVYTLYTIQSVHQLDGRLSNAHG